MIRAGAAVLPFVLLLAAAPQPPMPGSGGSTTRVAATTSPGSRYEPTPPQGVTCRARPALAVNLRCVIGRSVRGRAIVADRQGSGTAPRVLVVSGQMHGNEWPGPIVVSRIRRLTVPAGLQVWTVRTMNPDGRAVGQRHNAHGVDLNRNFPASWRPIAYAGKRALSEPEARAMTRFLAWVEPNLVISFHGFNESVDTTGGGRRAAAARLFSHLAHIGPAARVPCGGPCSGNMTNWYTATSTVRGVAFTVEMPRDSRGSRRCRVPGAKVRMPVIDCAARASIQLARTFS